MIPMMEVLNHLHLWVCEVWYNLFLFLHQIYLFIMCIMIIFDFSYGYFWSEIWWYLLLFLSIWYIYPPPKYSVNFFPKIKQTVWSQHRVNMLKVRFCGGVFFEKIWVPKNHYLCKVIKRRLKGGEGGVMVMKRENMMKKRKVLIMNRVVIYVEGMVAVGIGGGT